MTIDKNKLEGIYKKLKNKKSKYLVGYIPDNRIYAFILATRPFLDELESLSETIENELKIDYRRKSAIFRLLVFIMMGVFRANMNQISIILRNEKNTDLKEFLSCFSNETTISE